MLLNLPDGESCESPPLNVAIQRLPALSGSMAVIWLFGRPCCASHTIFLTPPVTRLIMPPPSVPAHTVLPLPDIAVTGPRLGAVPSLIGMLRNVRWFPAPPVVISWLLVEYIAADLGMNTTPFWNAVAQMLPCRSWKMSCILHLWRLMRSLRSLAGLIFCVS